LIAGVAGFWAITDHLQSFSSILHCSLELLGFFFSGKKKSIRYSVFYYLGAFIQAGKALVGLEGREVGLAKDRF
jgi:hypothetical protein